MKVIKIGHCCLLIEINSAGDATGGMRILTDPGAWNPGAEKITDIDLILITHEHADHLHIETVKELLANSPQVKIITNPSVGKILDKEGIKYEAVAHLQSSKIGEVEIEGFGEKHADVYPSIIPVENTGYFINNELFHPGDALTNPQKPVKILALPVAGPWIKISEAVDYAKELKPKYAFPIHDGMLKHLGSVHVLPENELSAEGIEFRAMMDGDTETFQ